MEIRACEGRREMYDKISEKRHSAYLLGLAELKLVAETKKQRERKRDEKSEKQTQLMGACLLPLKQNTKRYQNMPIIAGTTE